MKTTLLVFVMMLSVSMTYAAGNSNDPVIKKIDAAAMNNSSVGLAIAAIKSTCPNANGQLSYSVEVVSSCFAGGFITKVHFWKSPNCPGNQICIQIVEEVGTVTLGCNNEVIAVECGVSSI